QDTDDSEIEADRRPTFRCPRRFGYYPARKCYQFVQCSNYRPYTMNCARGTQWNQKLLTCVHATNCRRPKDVDEKDTDDEVVERRPVKPFRCPRKSGYYPARKCYQFVQCSNGRPYVMDCAPGTQWNQHKKTCVHETNCRRPRKLNESDDDEVVERRPARKFKCPRSAGYYRHHDCNRFVQCSNGRPYVMNCAPGTQWSQKMQTCVLLRNCRPRMAEESDASDEQ
ncbi:hypothetical protein BLA29_009518, partial [Euroglyphus maynei]